MNSLNEPEVAASTVPSLAERSSAGRPLTQVPVWVSSTTAVALLAIFVAFVIVMIAVAGDSSATMWARLLAVFSGLETLVFGAAGFLFGNRINSAQTREANEKTADAEEKAQKLGERADSLRSAASAGWALYDLISTGDDFQQSHNPSSSRDRASNLPGGSQKVGSSSPLLQPAEPQHTLSTQHLRAFADRLFEGLDRLP
jgi:hypothetical protein